MLKTEAAVLQLRPPKVQDTLTPVSARSPDELRAATPFIGDGNELAAA